MGQDVGTGFIDGEIRRDGRGDETLVIGGRTGMSERKESAVGIGSIAGIVLQSA
jgi:hypothetical protein